MITELKAYNSDILIEFRQSYIGPAMRKYGNMFRVTDCPLNPDKNRIGITDIRLISDTTPAHADMIIWSPQATIETASLQVLNTLFGVIQVSIDFNHYPREHLQMLGFWMDFMRDHRDVLLEGDFKPLYPEYLYPIIIAESPEKKIIAAYSYYCIDLEFRPQQRVWMINATLHRELIVNNRGNERRVTLKNYNCLGTCLSTQTLDLKPGVLALPVEATGFLTLEEVLI